MNLIVSLDVVTGEPVSTREFLGYNTLDKNEFIDFISTCGSIKNKLILADMCFISKVNIDYITSNDGFYIVPFSKNRKEYKECTKATRGKKASIIYSRGRKNDIVEYKEYDKDDKK